MKIAPDGVAIWSHQHGTWTGTFQDSTNDDAIDGAWKLAEELSGETRELLQSQGCECVTVCLRRVHKGQVVWTEREESRLGMEIHAGERALAFSRRHAKP